MSTKKDAGTTNSEKKKVTYTTNQEIKYLIETGDDDYCVEFVGYIDEIQGRVLANTDEGEKELFKAIITNGSKRLALLIWNDEIIETLEKKITLRKILHLDACKGHFVKATQAHKMLKLVNYELIIEQNTVVQFKGTHVSTSRALPAIPTVEFLEIPKSSGDIRVKAYIKTVVTLAYSKNGPLGFGCGTVTEGVHKLVINVSAFKAEDATVLSKGCCVMIQGNIPRTGPLKIICKNMSCIQVLTNEQKLEEAVVSAANKPLRRWNPEDDDTEFNAEKKSRMDLESSK